MYLEQLANAARDGRYVINPETHKLKKLIDHIRLDLQNLLNTRKSYWINNLFSFQLDSSLLNYGVDDLAQFDPASAHDRELLRETIEDVIQTYETRLSDVKVSVIEQKSDASFNITLRIEALLKLDKVEKPILFISEFDPIAYIFSVKETI